MSPPRESRPGDNRAAVSADAGTANDSLRSIPATSDEIRRRRDWASRMIRAAGGPLVVYGSHEWLELPETDRRRVAAVVTAAECWQQGCDDVPARLRREIAEGRAAHEALDDEDFATMAGKVRHLASVPTFAELSDRRGQPERAARARARADAIRRDADRTFRGASA